MEQSGGHSSILYPVIFLSAALAMTNPDTCSANNTSTIDSAFQEYTSKLSFMPKSFHGKDNRFLVKDEAGMPWAAIGKLDLGHEVPCTGTMLTPTIGITAAHCFGGTDSEKKTTTQKGKIAFPLNAITFTISNDTQADPSKTRLKSYFIPDIYHKNRLSHDFAFFRLNRPVKKISAFPKLTKTEINGLRNMQTSAVSVQQAGYSADANNKLTANIDARITYVNQNGFFHSGDVLPGDSGSPILVQTSGTYRILGVQESILNVPDTNTHYGHTVSAHVIRPYYQHYMKMTLNSFTP